MSLGFYVDLASCIGCKTCQVACKDRRDIQVAGPRLRRVDTFECGTYPEVAMFHLNLSCNHCESPACVANCPTGAMYKDDDGTVQHDDEACIGCQTCVNSCPYEVPQIDEEAGVSSKCTLCFDRLDNDHRPWCVQACPAEARIVGDLNDPESEVSKYIVELCVAIILAELELDKESIIAGLLHDVVEDTVMTSEDVAKEFGDEVALLVDGVTKLTQLNYQHDKIEVQAENLRKMFLAMAKDIRVILIKLADRLHNMRTMQYQSPAKQVEKSRETIDRKSTRLNSSHTDISRMPSSA